MNKKNMLYLFFCLILCLTFLDCSGGGGTGGESGGGTGVNPTPSVLQGQFIDGPIKNIFYETDTLSGFTDSAGTFDYTEGQTVRFYFGGILIGSSIGKKTLTPVDITNTFATHTTPHALNIARFLLSLDLDCDIGNGIELKRIENDYFSEYVINFSQTTADFENDVNVKYILEVLKQDIPCRNYDLVPLEFAKNHLRETILTLSGQVFFEEAKGIVDVAGSTISVSNTSSKVDRAYVKIPSDALISPQEIKMSTVTGNCNFMGESKEFFLSLEPAGLKFTKPIEVAFPYNINQDPNQLGIYFLDENDMSWKPLPIKNIDYTNKLIVFETNHFTEFHADNKPGIRYEVNPFYNKEKNKISVSVKFLTDLNGFSVTGTTMSLRKYIEKNYDAVMSCFTVKLIKQIDFLDGWKDDEIESKVICYRGYEINGGYRLQAYNKICNTSNDNVIFSKNTFGDFDLVEKIYSGDPVLFTFDAIPEGDTKYYVEVLHEYGWDFGGDCSVLRDFWLSKHSYSFSSCPLSGECYATDINSMPSNNLDQDQDNIKDIYDDDPSQPWLPSYPKTLVGVTPKIGTYQFWVDKNPTGRYLYISNLEDNNVVVVDTENNYNSDNRITINIKYPFGGAISPNGQKLYIANQSSNNVSIYNAYSPFQFLDKFDVGTSPNDVVITPDGKYAYITNMGSDNVSVVDLSNNSLITNIPSLNYPRFLAITPDGKRIYVAHEDGTHGVSYYGTAVNTRTGYVDGTSWCFQPVVSSDGRFVYVSTTNGLYVISTLTNQIVKKVEIQDFFGDVGIAITPNNYYVYIVGGRTNKIAIMRTTDNTVIDYISNGSLNQPFAISFTADGKRAYVTNRGTGMLSIIE